MTVPKKDFPVRHVLTLRTAHTGFYILGQEGAFWMKDFPSIDAAVAHARGLNLAGPAVLTIYGADGAKKKAITL